MSRRRAQRTAVEQRMERLPAAYWVQLEDVLTPRTGHRIDLVLVGPSGVHVVADRPGQPTSPAGATAAMAAGDPSVDLVAAAHRASAAALAVADLLPERYRGAVSSAVCLRGDTEVGVSVGVVLAASPDVLRHTWLHQPRVLSTSEAAAVADLLGRRLERVPPASAPARGRWWRAARRPRGGRTGA